MGHTTPAAPLRGNSFPIRTINTFFPQLAQLAASKANGPTVSPANPGGMVPESSPQPTPAPQSKTGPYLAQGVPSPKLPNPYFYGG